jgi:hypothetical protein
MSETLAVNTDRNFSVQAVPCLITKKFDRCIQVKLGTIAMPPDEAFPEGRVVEVVAAFSRAGLESLQRDLESVADPVGLPSQEEVRESSPYQWAVVCEDGEHYQQYPPGEAEKPFGDIHLPEVVQFWIIPRFDPNSLPWFGLKRGVGWVIRENGQDRSLDLPHPGYEAFWWQYYRSNTITFGLGMGQCDALPAHVVQCMGWKIGETVFEIGIENDGSYQVWTRKPLDDPRFA